MKIEKIYEDNNFIVYKDNKGYDFAYDIENKNKNAIKIVLNETEEEITIKDWLGLFESEKYIVESIINNDYMEVNYE